MNKLILTGKVEKVDFKAVPSGKFVANVIINNVYWANKEKRILRVGVTVWDKQATFAREWLRPGTEVLVDGRLISRAFKEKDGQMKEVIQVTGRVDVTRWAPRGAEKGMEIPHEKESEYAPY